jgi:hypothetical protein
MIDATILILTTLFPELIILMPDHPYPRPSRLTDRDEFFWSSRVQDFTAEEARKIYEVRELLGSFVLERVKQSNSGTGVDLGLNGRLYSC